MSSIWSKVVKAYRCNRSNIPLPSSKISQLIPHRSFMWECENWSDAWVSLPTLSAVSSMYSSEVRDMTVNWVSIVPAKYLMVHGWASQFECFRTRTLWEIRQLLCIVIPSVGEIPIGGKRTGTVIHPERGVPRRYLTYNPLDVVSRRWHPPSWPFRYRWRRFFQRRR